MRRSIAAFLTSCMEFARKHQFISMVLALAMAAACAAGLYLLYQQFPTLLQFPCFRGGCSN